MTCQEFGLSVLGLIENYVWAEEACWREGWGQKRTTRVSRNDVTQGFRMLARRTQTSVLQVLTRGEPKSKLFLFNSSSLRMDSWRCFLAGGPGFQGLISAIMRATDPQTRWVVGGRHKMNRTSTATSKNDTRQRDMGGEPGSLHAVDSKFLFNHLETRGATTTEKSISFALSTVT